MSPRLSYPAALLLSYLVCWTLLAIAPLDRQDWLLENVLVFIGLPLLVLARQRFSNMTVSCLFVFFVLHAIGAHYTYSEVPYDQWWQTLSGFSLNEQLGFTRNHYDRLVHFSYGLLVTPAAMQILDARAPQQGGWRLVVPFTFMVSHSAIYECIEWAAAEVFAGDLGQAYLGTQGDIWDAQKDTALALFGTVLAIALVRGHQRRAR